MATTTGPLGLPITTGDASDQYTKYMDVARQQTQGDFDMQKSAIDEATKTVVDANENVATTLLNQEPLIRQTYANLAKEFEFSEKIETDSASKTGEYNIGRATAFNADSGVQRGEGAVVANVTQQQEALKTTLDTIATKYNIQQESLVGQMNKEIGELQADAAKYRLQGASAKADGILKQVQLKMQQTEQINAIASAIQKTQDDNEKRALEQIQAAAQIEHDRQMAQIAAYNAQESARHNRAEEGISAQNAATARMNAQTAAAQAAAAQAEKNMPKYAQDKDSSGKVTGMSFNDSKGNPITAAQYVQQLTGRKDVADVLSMLRTYGSEGDKKTADTIQNAIDKGITGTRDTVDLKGNKITVPVTGGNMDAVMTNLTKQYPYIFGGV